MSKKSHFAKGILLSAATAGVIAAINKSLFMKAISGKLLDQEKFCVYNWRFGDVYYTKSVEGKPLLLIHDLQTASSGYEWSRVIKELFPVNSVFLEIEFFQTFSAGRFPYHTFGQGEVCRHGVGEVPWVHRVIVEIFHLVSLAVIVSETAVTHSQPHGAGNFRHPDASDIIFRHSYHLCEFLGIPRRRVDALYALSACGYPY